LPNIFDLTLKEMLSCCH